MEDKELLLCGNCDSEFDGDKRKPKFIPCRHLTLCLQCIKEIVAHSSTYECPLCHKIQDLRSHSLPDNTYIQYILKLKTKMETNSAHMIINQTGPNWCLTCDSVAHANCYRSGHGLLNLTADTIKNVERLVSLKREFKTMKDRLALAIDKRKEIRTHFTELMEAVESVQKDVKCKIEENDIQLAEWEALLEKNCLAEQPIPTTSATLDVDEFFLSELVTFVGRSRPDGTLETLKKKVEETALDYTAKLADITTKANDIEEHRKVRICVRMTDPSKNEGVLPYGDLLCDGFVTDSVIQSSALKPIEKASLLLLSHIVYTLHKHKSNQQTK